ncbi:hypothetical protein P775_11670 [Puniceibacterium antarcticum]|uniref:Uncharacterized protein n=1 Tax=Puniceibacterium antarcticum TaxID=1206336 RepID=A0A2G8REK6_9RHOB|nr:hypothetical protein P775_11670 [Puniceibacterium antarcticum]
MHTWPDDALISTHRGFNQSLFAVASTDLPFQLAICLHALCVVVSLAACLCIGSFHRVSARWNDNSRAGTVTDNCVVGWIAIISSIGSELIDLIVYLL